MSDREPRRLRVPVEQLAECIDRDHPRDVAYALVVATDLDVLDGRAAAWLRDVAAALDTGRFHR